MKKNPVGKFKVSSQLIRQQWRELYAAMNKLTPVAIVQTSFEWPDITVFHSVL